MTGKCLEGQKGVRDLNKEYGSSLNVPIKKERIFCPLLLIFALLLQRRIF